MQEDTRQCTMCGGNILAQCFDIHSRACAKKLTKSSIRKADIKSSLLDLIPCAECGEMVDFSVFSLHMEECVGRQLMKCPKCKLLYPTFLFQEHSNVCTEFRQEQPDELLLIEEPDEEKDEALDQMIRLLAKVNSKDNSDPLSPDTIGKMKKYVTNQSEQCSICYCEITKCSTIIRLQCPHKYHTKCLTAWLQKNPHCPMCRRHALY